MKKIGNFFAFTLCMLTFSSASFSQGKVSVTATVDTNTVAVGDYFDYTIRIQTESSSNISEPRLPSIQGFQFVGRSQSQEINTSFVNGEFKTVRSQSFIYRFQATQPGKFMLGAAEVNVNGQAVRTNKINVSVSEQATAQRQRPSRRQGGQNQPLLDDDPFSQLLKRRGYQSPPPENTNLAFFVRVEVDKKKAYVGEQVTASWYLYTRYNITDIDTLKYPTLKKFWKEDIEIATRLNFQQEIINGIPYRKALLAKYALFPIKPGKAKIDEYKAKCTVVMSSMLGGLGFGRPRTYTRSSEAVSIEVKPLPASGRPASFAGAVGEFVMKNSVSSKSVKVNEPFSYNLRFEGRGNAKRIDLPPMELSASLESYDTKTESKFFKDGRSYKDFELLFIPREPGKLVIPSVQMSYFDPQQEKYIEQSVPAMELDVAPGTRMSENQSTFGRKGEGEQVVVKKGIPDPLAGFSEASFLERHQKSIWISLYTAMFLLLGTKALVAFGFVTVRRDFAKDVRERAKIVRKEVKAQNWRQAGAGTHNLINFVLAEIVDDNAAAMSTQLMLSKVPPSLRREIEADIQKVTPAAEALGFGPDEIMNAVDKSTFSEDFNRLIVSLERVAERAHKYEQSPET